MTLMDRSWHLGELPMHFINLSWWPRAFFFPRFHCLLGLAPVSDITSVYLFFLRVLTAPLMFFDPRMRFVRMSVKRDCLLEASKRSLTGLPTVCALRQLVLTGLGVSCGWAEASR